MFVGALRQDLSRFGIILIFVVTSCSSVFGQLRSQGEIPTSRSNVAHNGPSVVVTVLDEHHKHLDRQAVVKLFDAGHRTTSWRTTKEESTAEFPDVSLGGYEVEVSAVGYLPSRRSVQVVTLLHATPVELVLHPDPSAVDLSAGEETLPPKPESRLSARRHL